MPTFKNNPFNKPQLLQKGVPAYLIGSFSQQVGNTKLAVLTDAIATNVATVTATLIDGPLPLTNTVISITNSANGTGEFNVNRVATASTSYNATTNVATITFALTGSNQAATADVGTAIIEPAEVTETVSAAYISQAIFVQAPEGDSQFTLPFVVNASSGITAMTATLEVAVNGDDSEWTATTSKVVKTGATTYTSGPVVEASLERGYCYRVNISAVTGSGTVVAKVG